MIRSILYKTASLGFLLALGITLAGCSKPAKAAEKSPVPVRVQSLQPSPSGALMRYSGSLEPATKVDVSFRVGGYVEELGQLAASGGSRALDKGDFVTKGTVLARVRLGDYAHKVSVAKAQVSEARAQAELAREDLRRARRLFDAGAIAKAELDATVARANSADAQVEGALARHGEAGVSLGDTVLRAPMDGVILSRSVEMGGLVSPGAPAFAIADTRTVRAVFGAPQSLVEKLRIGVPVRVFVGAETESKTPEKWLEAPVSRIAPAADATGRVFSVEAAVDNSRGSLRPGTVVSIHIPDPEPSANAMVVPLRAVVRSPREQRGFSVFVLEGAGERGTARLHDVRLGEVIGNSVTVTAGLQAQQRIITTGQNLLRDGSPAVVIR